MPIQEKKIAIKRKMMHIMHTTKKTRKTGKPVCPGA
jgi:hypothetical protein